MMTGAAVLAADLAAVDSVAVLADLAAAPAAAEAQAEVINVGLILLRAFSDFENNLKIF